LVRCHLGGTRTQSKSSMRRVGSLDSYLLSTNHWPGQHKGGVLLQCYKRKHLKIVIPLCISSNANSYFEIILTSLFPALYAWASAFNRHFLEMMPTVVLEGPPNTQKTTRAKKNLSFGSSNEMFFSGGSTVAGIQDVTAQYTQLVVLDDLDQASKELQWCVLGYGGAVTQTVSGGGRKSGAPLLLTMNPGASQRHEKLLTGRSVILKCQESPYQVKVYHHLYISTLSRQSFAQKHPGLVANSAQTEYCPTFLCVCVS